ncbi:MAG: hypothetical protein AB8F95_01260 [Bacteroidia bacterium]
MKFRFLRALLPVSLVLFFASISCDRPTDFIEEGVLEFSTDTLKFDSIFTTFQAPTGRLMVYNTTGENMLISKIWLAAGANSEFKMIVDGLEGDNTNFAEMELAKDDSMLVLVTFKSLERDAFIEEFVNFEVGGEMQRVLVRAKVLDAYLWRTTGRDDEGNLVLTQAITRDTTFATDKYTVIDGPLFITEGATLTLAPGTRIAFTPFRLDPVAGGNPLNSSSTFEFRLFSMIFVDDGSLQIQGTASNPVQLQGVRFDTTTLADYNELPGQWRGIQFSKNSFNNRIEHCVMKNGLLGIRVDSVSYRPEPILTMKHVEIRNMAAFGLQCLGFNGSAPDDLGTAPQVVAENCQIYNCKERTVSISGGGWQEFYNCTFASYNFSRRNPSFSLANYLTLDGQVIEEEYAQKSIMANCVIYGTESEELLVENFDFYNRSHEVRFDHCLVRTSTDPDREYDYEPYFFNTLQNDDPEFHNTREFDHRPEENSPMIDAGLDLSSRYMVDFRDDATFSRQVPFDIGAFEYYEIE